jgi:hypothetical protein
MESGATLRIKLASSNETDSADIVADRFLLDFWSSCARGLPADAAEWDLSQLLVEGKAVERSTVVAWLNAAHQITHLKDFEQQQDNPAVNMTGLVELLGFADAVGSSRGLLHACLANLSQLKCDVRTSSAGAYYLLDPATAYQWVQRMVASQVLRYLAACGNPLVQVVSADTPEQRISFMQLVLTPIESLLYLSYKLQLPALESKLQTFISINSSRTYMLYDCLDEVVSARVLDAAAGNTELLKQLVVNKLTGSIV